MKFKDTSVSDLQGIPNQGLFHEVWLSGNNDIGEWRLIRIEEDGGQLVAAFLAWSKKTWWGKQLITPPLMPTVGVYMESGILKKSSQNTKRKEVLQTLLEGLKKSEYAFWKLDYPPEWNDFQPFIWSGIQPTLKYTYRIELRSNWREQVHGKLKNLLAKSDSYQFTNNRFTNEQWQLFQAGLNQYGITGGKGFQEMCFSADSPFHCISDVNNHFLAICGNFDGVMYYFAAVNEKSDNAISACGLMYCIELAERMGVSIFDFEGSMMPNVERFFRSFGGQLINYGSVSGGKWWIQKLKKIRK